MTFLVMRGYPTPEDTHPMLYVIAVVLPPLALLLAGKPFQAVFNLILQATLIGWLPAALWALFVVQGRDADRRADRLVRSMRDARRGRD